MSVKVAVRVRPFNQRERDMGAKLCVEMNGMTTVLKDPKTGNPRDFSFDYSFWSHDQFIEREDGYLMPEGQKYADQRFVYEALGEQILDNAWEGYHCCLFAYGQTGSGKSYSMIGYGANRGIVPISSEEIFTRIASNQNPNLTYEVTVSMLEIYNERIQDLLIPINRRPTGGLRVRESKIVGVFVDGLTKHPVSSYAEVEHMMEIGNTNRSIGSTKMNATSSRAHTIFTIELKQIELDQDRKMEKFSVINLVDLAGSEKAGQTGAEGQRLKEGCAINKSLVVLGSVIEALADKSSGKKANIVVPYRDSALTRILQNALGGNSKTVMICALSPATVNYEETLSTLRYADRAKKIKNNAVVNESVQDRIIRELREEIGELKSLIDQVGGLDKLKELQEHFEQNRPLAPIQRSNQEEQPAPQNEVDESKFTELKEENNQLKQLIDQVGGKDKIKELQELLEMNEQLVREQTQTWQEKKEQFENEEEVVEVLDKTNPYITNINEDPQLSGRVFYNFDKQRLVVGRKNADPPVDIVLSSSSVKPRHCVISKEEEEYFIEPCCEQAFDFLFVNGARITEKTKLNNSDRIIIGTSTVFLFKNPNQEEESQIREVDIDYEFVMQEKIDLTEKEVTEEYRKSQSADQIKQATSQDENPTQFFDPNNELRRGLHGRLAQTYPLVNEANLLVKEFNRNIKFSVKIINSLPDEVEAGSDLDPDSWEKITMVEVVNHDYGLIWLWDVDKFEDRLCTCRELLNDDVFEVDQDDDPLWDPPTPFLIGKGYYSLKPLGYLFDNPFDILIINTQGGDAGNLRVNIIPTDAQGQLIDYGPDEPEELIGQSIHFRVDITEAWNIPENFANNVFCEYNFPGIGLRRTSIVNDFCEHPVFNYSALFTNIFVDESLCNFLQKKNLAISVYGTGMTSKQKIEPIRQPDFSKTVAGVHSRKKSNNIRGTVAAGDRGRAISDDFDDKKDKKCVVF